MPELKTSTSLLATPPFQASHLARFFLAPCRDYYLTSAAVWCYSPILTGPATPFEHPVLPP